MPIGQDLPSPDAIAERDTHDYALKHSATSGKDSAIGGPSVADVKKVMAELEPRIVETLSRYETKRAALLPVLHMMQRRFRHLSPIVQREVAYRLGLAPADVFRVVEFYTLFRGEPCGRKVVMVCGTLSCELAGANAVLGAVMKHCGVSEHGVPSADGEFSVERVECLGWCDRAPVMQINESDFFDAVTPEKAVAIVKEYRDGAGPEEKK